MEGLSERPKRPISVWLTQFFILCPAVITISLPFLEVYRLVQVLTYYGADLSSNFSALLRQFLIFLALVIPFFTAELVIFWGLARGKRFSRWSAIATLSLAFLLLLPWLFLRQDGLVDYYRAIKGTEILGNISLYILLVSPFLYLIYCLGFGEKERDFFNWKPSLPVSDPPPPPSFDEEKTYGN